MNYKNVNIGKSAKKHENFELILLEHFEVNMGNNERVFFVD